MSIPSVLSLVDVLMGIFRCLLVLALVGASASCAATGNRILVFGDSLSAAYGMAPEQGWVAALATRMSRIQPSWQVENASLSGETTAGGLARLAAVLASRKPNLVVLELGGNDGLQGLALGQTRNNLQRMVERVRSAGARVLLLGMRIPPNYGPVYTRKFHDIYTDLATQMKLAYVPFFLQGVATDPTLMQADGIHPRAVAQVQLLDNLWPQLLKLVGSKK